MGADTVTAPINVAPAGLLDFLQTKALGQNPNELLQGVRATIDLTSFWWQGAPVQIVVSTQAAVITSGAITGGTAELTVPPGQVWVPLSIVSIITASGAGDSGRGRACILLPGVAQFVCEIAPPAFIASSFTPAGSSTTSWNFLDSKPRILTAGMRIAPWLDINTVTTTGQQTTLNVRYLQFGQ